MYLKKLTQQKQGIKGLLNLFTYQDKKNLFVVILTYKEKTLKKFFYFFFFVFFLKKFYIFFIQQKKKVCFTKKMTQL